MASHLPLPPTTIMPGAPSTMVESHLKQLSREPSSADTFRRFRQRTETARERDVFRYLQPWSEMYKPVSLNRLAFPSDANEPLPEPQPCSDPSLAAFAQLCALRLNARRCFVTLISSRVEYVLAEATKSMSLQYESVEDLKDKAWLGTCSIMREDGVNSVALNGWRKARSLRELPTEEELYYTQGNSPHWQIVNDMWHSFELKDKVFVRRARCARFLCSVPLRGMQGSVVGSLTVIDDKPRYGVSSNEMALMEDIADTITEHLDATVVRSQRQRSERLIQGLGLFNNGKASLRDWWLGQDDARLLSTGRYTKNESSMRSRQARVDTEFGFQQSAEGPELEPVSGRLGSYSRRRAVKDDSSNRNAESKEQNRIDTGRTENPESWHRRSPMVQRVLTSNRLFDLNKESEKTYARASNLLREALSADGVVFVDASSMPAVPSRPKTSGNDGVLSGSDHILNQTTSETDGSDGDLSAPTMSKVLGFSTREKASVTGFKASTLHFDMPEVLLERLVKRYPNGRIFTFDDSGAMHTSSDESVPSASDDSTSKKKRPLKYGQPLGKIMQGAHSIACYPIWDETQDRWRSCALVWSCTPYRFFDQAEDLTYLSSFGHSLLAELLRLETLAADKAKGTFISSVSHELRSPLHGVLAGVELLQESDLTTFQQEMTHTISMAGRTLLDTINHILDYSKISNFTREQRRERVTADASRRKSRLNANPDEIGVTSNVDLALLTEQVVETMVSAHRSQCKSQSMVQTPSETDNDIQRFYMQRSIQSISGAEDLSVTLNISWSKNWIVELQPGGWTRIVTNLVGNALKYTPKGSVSVRLRKEESIDNTERCPVELIIEDTGVGISSTFLASDLFTPFKQENSHSTGTGLGLSIVKQIVAEIGASLDIKSKPGKGTRVVLRFLANFVPLGAESQLVHTDDFVSKSSRRLSVDRFHLLTFDGEDDSDVPTGPLSVGHSTLESGKDWLGCEGSEGSELISTSGSSVCAIAETDLLMWAQKSPEDLAAAFEKMARQVSHVLVLGRSVLSLFPHISFNQYPIKPVFIHQPVGPRKLLRAIMSDKDSVSAPMSPLHGFEDLEPTGSMPQSPGDCDGSYSRFSRSKGNMIEPGRTINADLRPLDFQPIRPIRKRGSSNGSKQTSLAAGTDGPATSEIGYPTSQSSESTAHPTSRTSESTAPPKEADDKSEVRDTVLLVEDNDLNMKLLMALMRKLRQKFQCAVNGREALDAYCSTPENFFLILMDMSMPVMDGFAATAQIREAERKRHLRRTTIIALTGVTSEDAKKRAFDCGIDEYYAKPVKMDEVRGLIDRAQAE